MTFKLVPAYVTVDDLHRMCEQLRAHGCGNKSILISNGNEDKGFHNLCHTFTMPHSLAMDVYKLPDDVNPDDMGEYILLG